MVAPSTRRNLRRIDAVPRSSHPSHQTESSHRALSDEVHGDVNGDGVTDTGDLTAVVNTKAQTLDPSSMSPNQLLWLDANRDGSNANAGDVLYAARACQGDGARCLDRCRARHRAATSWC